MGAFDVFDAVAAGDIQGYHGADYYWIGKNPAFAYITAVPFGLTSVEQNAFIYDMGGQQIWDEQRAFEVSNDPDVLQAKPKFYVLDMFPYP